MTRALTLLTLTLALWLPGWIPSAIADQTVRLQLRWLHQFQFAGYYMALEKGFYRESGLNVQIAQGGPLVTRPIEEVLNGKADFAITNSGLVIERLNGKPVVALAAIMQTSPLVWLVRGESNIYVPHDLVGKRLMMMPAPESTELLTVFRQEGIDASQLDITPMSYRLSDLINGKIDAFDAYSSNEPFYLRKRGIPYRTISPREYGVNFYSDVLMTRDDIVRDNPQMVKDFTQASLRGWEYALAHTEETIALIQRKYAPDKEIEHLRFEAEALRKLIMPELVQLGHMNPGRWDFIANSYVQLGLAKGPVRLEGFIHNGNGETDYRLAYKVGGVALLLLLTFGAITVRFARLSQALRREMGLRQTTEEELRNSNAALEQLATFDRLTGLWNRLKFEEFASTEISRAQRYEQGLALIMFDIDHFKAINDLYGHQAGDSVLVGISRLMSEHLRESDGIGRWGGEEFLILAPCADPAEALQIAEKLRAIVAAQEFPEVGTATASFGVTFLLQDDTLDQMVKRADMALYRAKESGRNRVVAALKNDHTAGLPTLRTPILRLNWNESFAFGVADLDREHRQLIDSANAVIQSIENEEPKESILLQMTQLLAEFGDHCQHEENDMAADNYPGRVEHMAAHKMLLGQGGQMIANWDIGEATLGDLVNFMVRGVIARHIMTADRAYAMYRLNLAA
jgi:diguanylate cyclase (GGDEF)-like protein/hemerythrin-like metal-binding protein